MDAPSNDEHVSFSTDIKPLFRQHDRQAMEKAFDLWSFDDVRSHASDILERVKNGSMPCDGAWPPERVQLFARWIRSGMAAQLFSGREDPTRVKNPGRSVRPT